MFHQLRLRCLRRLVALAGGGGLLGRGRTLRGRARCRRGPVLLAAFLAGDVRLGLASAAARLLAADFEVPVEFICGSFIPTGAQDGMRLDSSFAWLNTTECGGLEELGLDVDDFGIIFAYPWPDEEEFTEKLFETYAQVGAVLVTHHGGDVFRVRRKINGRKSDR